MGSLLHCLFAIGSTVMFWMSLYTGENTLSSHELPEREGKKEDAGKWRFVLKKLICMVVGMWNFSFYFCLCALIQ